MLSDIDRNHRITNWALLVRNVLADLGFYKVWLQQNVGNPVKFLSLVKQRLYDNFLQKWNIEINGSTRANFYKNISNFGFQSYLDIVTIKKFRTALSRLRLSSHRLKVEMGRWVRPVRVQCENNRCRM